MQTKYGVILHEIILRVGVMYSVYWFNKIFTHVQLIKTTEKGYNLATSSGLKLSKRTLYPKKIEDDKLTFLLPRSITAQPM